ncbi:TetR/AcrR family transcriptional regulator [Fodinicola acaciae]|uniref:TetR/AcrR family transcriptional regulator n=1 Tax=Fodinicola acaciae TaxID=2681555 RepID=UPI0013D737FC|nr:TetR/AcrR family transcriptional regulator [Fodinicola acaciae]
MTVKPMRADARRNYERLLACAQEAFNAHGVDASLEDIARAAEVGIGTLYRHFPTRDALLEALMAERFQRAADSAGQLLSEPDPVDALRSWLREFIRGASAYRGLPESVMAVLTDPESQLYASCHAMQESAAKLWQRAQKAGTVRKDVSAPDAFLMAAGISWAAERAAEDPARVERFLDVLIDGLRSR